MFIDPKCKGCGKCCMVLDKIENPAAKALDRGDGVCMHLDEQNQCRIYENRPYECNTFSVLKGMFGRSPTDDEMRIWHYATCRIVNNILEHSGELSR